MRMDDATLLGEVGQALWGPVWKGAMAEAVRHQKSAVSDWASGRMPVPAGVWSELKEIMRRRRHELDNLVRRTQKAHDTALERTVEQTRLGKGGRKA
jgi:hypothetical protein